MAVSGFLVAALLAVQAAPAAPAQQSTAEPVAQPLPSGAAASTPTLPARLTCIYDELPANRPMLSLDDEGSMQRLVPIIFPADERCVARHGMNEAARSLALRYAFNQHQLDVYEQRLALVDLPMASMRRYFSTMGAERINRLRARTATRDDAIHLYTFLEREGVVARAQRARNQGQSLGDLTASVIILLVDEVDLINEQR